MSDHEERARPEAPAGEREIGERIRSAGRRPEIPADDLAAIRATAGAAWREMVATEGRRRRRRRVVYTLAASVLLALPGVWWLARRATPAVPTDVATVELATGRVRAAATGSERDTGFDVAAGVRLSSGTTLTTATFEREPAARVALRLAGGRSVRLDAGTRLRLVARSRLELVRGAVYVDSGPSPPRDADLEILTPLGRVREVGTQYEVRLSATADAVHVRVREGSVSVLRGGESHAAGRGEQLTLDRDGAVARGELDTDGPEWLWVLAAAPAPSIEGRSLESFLEWVARETGRQVRYADRELEQAARTIRLHGTIEGLQPDESIGVILQGSGLDHRIEDGALVVVRP